MVNIETLKSSTGECYGCISDLLELFQDAQDHPEKYDEEIIIRLAEEVIGKRTIKPTTNKPF